MIKNFIYFFKKKVKSSIIKISKVLKIFPDEIQENFEINYNDTKILFSPSNDITYRRWSKFQKDGKEKNTIEFIDKFEKDNIFFDIGANVGVFSLYASLKKKVKVYAFEPEVNSFINLIKAIKLNNADIVPILAPLSNETKMGHFNYRNFIGAGFSMHQFGEEDKTKFSYLVASDTLNNLFLNKKLPCPNYIKLDVDGIEMQILEGMSDILKNKTLQSILVEVNSETEKESINNYLYKLGFKNISGPTGNNTNYTYARNV
jgi:FkbM family methyltransferase